MARYLTSRYNVRLDFYTPTNAAPQIPKPVTWFPSPLFGKAYLRYTRESPRSDRPYRYYTVTLRYTYYDEENETILHTKPDHSIREEETVLPNIVQKFETIDDAINELKVLGFTLIDPIDLLYLYRQRTLCSPNYYIGRVLQEFDKIVTGLYQLGTIYDVDDYEDRRDDLMDFLQQLGNAIDYDEIEFLVEPEDYNETRIYEYRDALERYLTSNMDNNSHPADSEPLPH